MMEKEVIETRVAKIRLDKNNILHIIMKDQANIELEDVKEIIKAHFKLSKAKKDQVLTDARNVKAITREARIYSAEESSKLTSANAVLVNSSLSRVMGTLYIRINKPLYPTRLFTSEKKAIEWLKGFVEKDNEEGDQ